MDGTSRARQDWGCLCPRGHLDTGSLILGALGPTVMGGVLNHDGGTSKVPLFSDQGPGQREARGCKI